MGSSQNKIQHPTYFHGNAENATTDTTVITTCDSCALCEIQPFYEWELIGSDFLPTALKFTEELIPWNNNQKKLKNKIYSINKGYLTMRLNKLKEPAANKIRELFDQAYKECNPRFILDAYCRDQSFCTLLNNDMARIVMHDIYNGCSKFSCDTLYATQDGTKSIVSILFHHPEFITYRGTVYRGMFLPGNFAHIQVNQCIMTKTLLSTSKKREVAERFSGYDRLEDKLDSNDENKTSIVCTFIIKNINGNRRALDISGISNIRDEEEVLLLPYSVFRVTKRKTIDVRDSDRKRIEVEFEECDVEQLESSINKQ